MPLPYPGLSHSAPGLTFSTTFEPSTFKTESYCILVSSPAQSRDTLDKEIF